MKGSIVYFSVRKKLYSNTNRLTDNQFLTFVGDIRPDSASESLWWRRRPKLYRPEDGRISPDGRA